jgi:malate dehydrogenase (oxaloacetate-decarboxylating)(NADP+)
MAPDPIVFAMANPDPEIPYDVARATRPDVIMATGRSDYPNQVNNVLGFPFIFRGALDVRARAINDEMKMAATRALAALAREDVPEAVLKAYGIERLSFGPDYLIPKPFDPRVLLRVAPAVAEAAIRSGAAQRPIRDLDAYRESLERIMGPSRRVMRMVVHKAQHAEPRRIVLPDAEEPTVVRAARMIADQHIARPVLVGSAPVIAARLDAAGLDSGAVDVIDPLQSDHLGDYADMLYRWRRRKGMTPARARALVRDPSIFGLLMVSRGHADGFVGGMYKPYPETIRPAIQIVGLRDGVSRVSAVNLIVLKDRLLFFADTMVNVEPNAEELAEIAILAADTARFFDVEPRVALLSFSNFGSARHPSAARVAEAAQLARERRPDLLIDGELNVETALVEEIAREHFPHSEIQGDANVLVFPDLAAGNIGYKIAHRLGKADMVGPILMGMRRPVNVLPPGASAADIVNVAAITAVAAEMDRDSPSAVEWLEHAEV